MKAAKFISLSLLVCLCFTLGACKEKEPPHPNHAAYASEIVYHAYVVANNYDTRIYYNDRNLQFGLDNESKLQFYFWGDNDHGDKIYTEQECLEIARRFLIPYVEVEHQCTHEGATCSFADRIGLLVDI